MDGSTPSRNSVYTPIILVLIACFLLGLFLLIRKSTSVPEKKANIKNREVVKKTNITPLTGPAGSLKLRRAEDRALGLNDSLDVILSVLTQKQAIAGYDAVLQYDPLQLRFENLENLVNDGFTVTRQESEGRLRISGFVKDPGVDDVAIDAEDLVKVRFTVLRAGSGTVSLAFRNGDTDDSNIMDKYVRDFLVSVENVSFNVGIPLKLVKGQTVSIPETPWSVTFVSALIPSPDCRDCMQLADFTLQDKSGSKHEVSFKSGGFAGTLINEVQAGPFTVSLVDVTERNAAITILPE